MVINASYAACHAKAFTRERRKVCCPARKLMPSNERFELIIYLFREGFSPEQIAGKLRRMKINFEEAYVRRETIYNAIYALPVGELRKELSCVCPKVEAAADRAVTAFTGAARSRTW